MVNHDNGNEWLNWLDNLRANWKGIALFVFVFACIGAFVAMWTRSVYQAQSTVKVESKMGGFSSMLGNIGGLLSSEGSAETEIEIIRSQRVIQNAIIAAGLQNVATPVSVMNRLFHHEGRLDIRKLSLPDTLVLAPERRGIPWIIVVKDSMHYALLDDMGTKVLEGERGKDYAVGYAGDSVKINVSRIYSHKGERFAIQHVDMRDALAAFMPLLNVTERGKSTGIIELAYQDQYPDRARNIVNSLTNAYLRQNVEFSNSDAQRTLAFLEKQVPDVKRKLDSAEFLLNSYRSKVGSVDIGAETQIALESQTQLQRQILLLQQERQEKIRLFSVSHPAVQTLDSQIASLQGELNRVGSRARALPAKQQETFNLMREVEFEQALYTELLQRIEQLRLIAVGDAGTARVVDYAEIPLKPVKPKRKYMVLIAMMLGFCVSVMFFSAKQKILGGVKGIYSIERELEVNVYSCIPVANFKKGKQPASLLVSDKKHAQVVEALHTLHASLKLTLADAPCVISVVSLRSGVGKSFVASNLAVLFANAGKKTLVIDANLHKGVIASAFKCSGSNGLAEALLDRVSIDTALQSTNVPGLSILAPGKKLASPVELLSSAKFSTLLSRLRSDYDVIIIDTPPLAFMTDALFISRVADIALIVSEYNRHSADSIRDGLDLLSKNKETLRKAIVFNKYKSKKTEYSDA